MNMKRALLWASSLFLLTAGGLAGCSKKAAPAGADAGTAAAPVQAAVPPAPPPAQWKPLLALLPADPMMVLFAGDGAGLLRSAKEALGKLRGTSVGMLLEELVRMTQHKLGLADLDAFDPAAWLTRGFDFARGAALVQSDADHGVFFLGVSDPAKVEPFVQSFLRKADEVETFKKVGEVTVAFAKGGKPAAAYQFHQGYLLLVGPVASEADAAARLATVTRPAGPRLQGSPAFVEVAGKAELGRGVHVLLFPSMVATFPPEGKAMFGGFKGLSVQVEVSAQGATAQVYAPTSAETASALQALAAPAAPTPGLARALGDDTLLALGGRVHLWALVQKVIGLSAPVKALVNSVFERLKTKLDIDFEKELFQNLTGDSALGIHKLDAAVFPLFLGGTSAGKLLQADPFHLTLLLRVKDAVMAGKLLRKLGTLMDSAIEKVGAIEVFPVAFARLVGGEAEKGGPALRVALSGDTVVLTVGRGRMEKALQALAAKEGPFAARVGDPDTRARLIERPGAPVGYLLGATLLENLKELEAALLKKGSLMLSNIVQKIVETVERVSDLSLGGEALPTGVRGWVRLRLK